MNFVETFRRYLPKSRRMPPESSEYYNYQRNTHRYSYGETVLTWVDESKVERASGLDIHSHALSLRLGKHSLDLPTKRVGIEINTIVESGASYNWDERLISYDKYDFSSPDFPPTMVEEYEHSQTFPLITRALSKINSSKDIQHFPRILNTLPDPIKEALLQQAPAFRSNDYLHHRHSGAASAASLAHEFITKRITVQQLVKWSQGDIRQFTEYNPALGNPEKIFFELEYLKLLLHAPSVDQLPLWSWGVPLDNTLLSEDILDIKRKIRDRIEYLQLGRPGSRDAINYAFTAWIPDNYQALPLYHYLFDAY